MRIRSSNWADDTAPAAADRAERVGVAPAVSAAQVDPSLVAAFDLELPYVVALRTVRSRSSSSSGRSARAA